MPAKKSSKTSGRIISVRGSAIHGRGVFAVRDIAKGERIIEYKGRLITEAAADERYGDDEGNHTFLFLLDNDVNAPEALHGFFDEALHVAGLRRIRHHGQHFSAEFPALGGFGFHDVGAPRANRHHRTQFGDPCGRCPAYAFAAAGDRDDLAFETQLHINSPGENNSNSSQKYNTD